MHMNLEDKKVKYLIGHGGMALKSHQLLPYDSLVCDFLSDLSTILLRDIDSKKYPDIVTFAFWCRRANIQALKKNFNGSHLRVPIGVVFHIAPANVPINFAYSYVFSLLAGNANIVRVPSRDFEQTEIICRGIRKLFNMEKYGPISQMTLLIKYGHDDQITSTLSSECNARIIWGGDAAIKDIRKAPISTRSVELVFADRYSICLINADKILSATQLELKKLAEDFYNDVYLMDQNACSSPHLILWLGSDEDAKDAKYKFWQNVSLLVASKYDLKPVNAIEKYTLLCEQAIVLNDISNFEQFGNFIYRLELSKLPENMDSCRGKYGFFYEHVISDINNVSHIINAKYQTLTYYGVEKALLSDFVVQNHLIGIDRIVPIGAALDIGVIWDGYDIVRCLSRIVDIK